MRFKAKTIEQEQGILFYDIFMLDKNFTKTRKYLKPLIIKIINNFCDELNKKDKDMLYREIDEKVVLAVIRYMGNIKENIKYKFSTYFTWYIKEIIKNRL